MVLSGEIGLGGGGGGGGEQDRMYTSTYSGHTHFY